MATIKGYRKHLTRSRRSYRTRLMFKALEVGNLPMMKLLLKEGGLQMNARSAASGETLLQVAAAYGRCITVIRRLVRAGCCINSANDLSTTGDTALHLAVRYNKIDVAKKLIQLGAKVRAKNRHGETPLHLAVAYKISHMDELKQMMPNGDRYSEMNFNGLDSLGMAVVAAKKRDCSQDLNGVSHSLVKMLLDSGADVNARDDFGCWPIQCAVYTGNLELVNALIDAGAHVDNRNGSGATALHDAVLSCNEAMVHLLLSRGAKVDIKTERGDTALHWAAQLNIDNSHEGIMRRLMEFGSDLNQENMRAETPFHCILRLGDVDLVSLFIDEHKADLNKLQSRSSDNALAFAAQNQDERVMDLVLQTNSGLEIDHKCIGDRLTPLHRASALSLLGNVRWLISRGADVNAKDNRDQTPLFKCILQPQTYNFDRDEIPLTFFRANFAEEKRRVVRLLLECGADVNNHATLFRSLPDFQKTTLELAIFTKDIETWKAIIEYAAEVETRSNESLLDGYNLRVIEKNPEVESYYRKCRAELTAMRTAKIEGSLVSYLSVLTQQLDVVARYARNDELVRNLQYTLQTDAYPIFAPQLKNKLDAANARKKTIDQVTTVLSETLQFANPTDLIFENILKYLTEDDVKFLIGSA